jgi:polar amino acid transport system substrate-binding protein
MFSRRKPSLLMLGTFIFVMITVTAHAGEVITASPSWKGFTSRDGQGLYHDLMRAIYEPGGETVRHLEVPAKRGLLMVREGQADIFTCRAQTVDKLQMASLPMYEGEYHALFRTTAFPHWDGVRSMANMRVVWRLGYYAPNDFPVPIDHSETLSGVEALQRVLREGADFYVDDRNLIMESFSALGIALDEAKFRIESVGFRQYFPLFSTSERGTKLRKIFEEGMPTLTLSPNTNSLRPDPKRSMRKTRNRSSSEAWVSL